MSDLICAALQQEAKDWQGLSLVPQYVHQSRTLEALSDDTAVPLLTARAFHCSQMSEGVHPLFSESREGGHGEIAPVVENKGLRKYSVRLSCAY